MKATTSLWHKENSPKKVQFAKGHPDDRQGVAWLVSITLFAVVIKPLVSLLT